MQEQNPLVCIRPVTQLGGAEKSTLALIQEINKTRKVVVLDYYGCCKEYLELLDSYNIEYKIIMPEAKTRTIGGGNKLDRMFRLLKAYKEMSLFINKLQVVLEKIKPQMIWFNDDKSMYCVGKALEKNGTATTTAMFIRGDIGELKWICKKYWKKLHCIVGNNSVSIRYYAKYSWLRDKLKIAYNGIDIEAVREASKATLVNIPQQDRIFKIVLPAMFIPLKAQDVAIKGFAEFVKKYDNSVLWLCGNTPNDLPSDYENSLKMLVRKLGIEDKVCFMGWRKDVPALIKKADIMILTSTTEGLPRSILEAMAVGTPVVSTKAGGVVDLIVDGENGMLVDIGDYKALAGKMSELANSQLRNKLVYNATKTVEQKFTIAKQAIAFLECIGVQ